MTSKENDEAPCGGCSANLRPCGVVENVKECACGGNGNCQDCSCKKSKLSEC
ncbi:MAG: hypothetical protein WA103_05080 [Minisyncoccales bacterium]